MGSDTDLPVMSESAKMLEKFGIPYEIEVVSAHRSPARTHEYASSAIARGLKVVIVAAGGAAHLAGVVASLTTIPVIAVPMATTVLSGIDALLSSVQMPAGVPVAAMAIDKPGAINAAIYAAEILSNVRSRGGETPRRLQRGVGEIRGGEKRPREAAVRLKEELMTRGWSAAEKVFTRAAVAGKDLTSGPFGSFPRPECPSMKQ